MVTHAPPLPPAAKGLSTSWIAGLYSPLPWWLPPALRPRGQTTSSNGSRCLGSLQSRVVPEAPTTVGSPDYTRPEAGARDGMRSPLGYWTARHTTAPVSVWATRRACRFAAVAFPRPAPPARPLPRWPTKAALAEKQYERREIDHVSEHHPRDNPPGRAPALARPTGRRHARRKKTHRL